MPRLLVLLTLACFCLPAPAWPLDVYYIEYPPYYYTGNQGNPDGFLLLKALNYFKCAKLDYNLSSMPSKRIMQTLRSESNVASIGWFMTEERKGFAKFSLPIYENKPQQAVTLKTNLEKFAGHKTLKDLLCETGLKLGIIDGHSEGDYIDALLRAYPENVRPIITEELNLVKMLGSGRIDYIILQPEETEELLSSAELNPGDFAAIDLEDMPPGNKRYLIFSRDVPDSSIESLNQCIIGQAGQP